MLDTEFFLLFDTDYTVILLVEFVPMKCAPLLLRKFHGIN